MSTEVHFLRYRNSYPRKIEGKEKSIKFHRTYLYVFFHCFGDTPIFCENCLEKNNWSE